MGIGLPLFAPRDLEGPHHQEERKEAAGTSKVELDLETVLDKFVVKVTLLGGPLVSAWEQKFARSVLACVVFGCGEAIPVP